MKSTKFLNLMICLLIMPQFLMSNSFAQTSAQDIAQVEKQVGSIEAQSAQVISMKRNLNSIDDLNSKIQDTTAKIKQTEDLYNHLDTLQPSVDLKTQKDALTTQHAQLTQLLSIQKSALASLPNRDKLALDISSETNSYNQEIADLNPTAKKEVMKAAIELEINRCDQDQKVLDALTTKLANRTNWTSDIVGTLGIFIGFPMVGATSDAIGSKQGNGLVGSGDVKVDAQIAAMKNEVGASNWVDGYMDEAWGPLAPKLTDSYAKEYPGQVSRLKNLINERNAEVDTIGRQAKFAALGVLTADLVAMGSAGYYDASVRDKLKQEISDQQTKVNTERAQYESMKKFYQ